MPSARLLTLGSLLTLLIITSLIYAPALSGPFILDDFWNLEPLGADGGINSFDALRQYVFSNTSGPTGRPVSMLSFVLNAQDWPTSPIVFKTTNLIIHLLCGVVIMWFGYLLAQSLGASSKRAQFLALAVTAIWLLHPLNTSTTLYVVQRMTQLMTLFATLSLCFYLLGRNLVQDNPQRSLLYLGVALFPFGLLAVLSKENGALLLLLIVALEFTVFRRRPCSTLFAWWYRAGVLLPVFIIVAYSLYTLPANLQLYEIRNFGLVERLLTEMRILLIYIREIFLPTALGKGLFHDDITVSTGLFSPVTTFLATLTVAGSLTAAFLFRKSAPVFALAIFWFVALHILESTYLPLELYFEHRNYMAMIGPLFAMLWYGGLLMDVTNDSVNKWVIAAIFGIMVTVAGISTASLARQWSNGLQLVVTWADERPRSVRAQSTLAEYLVALDLPDLAMDQYRNSLELAPGEVTLMLRSWNHACEYGLNPPVSLEAIAAHDNLVYYRDDINSHLRKLLENLQDQRCNFPEFTVLERLFARIGEFPLPDWRQVGFHTFFSDLYVHFRLLDPALIHLTRAFAIDPKPQFPIRQAIISVSAGNFADALVFVDRAKQADSVRNPLLPSMMDEILELEEEILARMPANYNQ